MLGDQVAFKELALLAAFGHGDRGVRKKRLRVFAEQQDRTRRYLVGAGLMNHQALLAHERQERIARYRRALELDAVFAHDRQGEIKIEVI